MNSNGQIDYPDKVVTYPYPAGAMQSAPAGSQIQGILDGVNPGTRELVVTAHQHIINRPIDAYGVYLPLGGTLTVNTDTKFRAAIFSADGDIWKGVTGTSTALPWNLIVGDTTSTALSAMKTSALGAVSGRWIGKNFGSNANARIVPQRVWVVIASEGQYVADTINTSIFWGGDSPGLFPHQLGTTGASRNVAWGTVLTTAINSFSWTTFAKQSASSWTLATGTAGAFAFASARTHSGGLGNWQWGILGQPL